MPRRCPRCDRILFPLSNGMLPPHKQPPPRKAAHQPLTGLGDPWCLGSWWDDGSLRAENSFTSPVE